MAGPNGTEAGERRERLARNEAIERDLNATRAEWIGGDGTDGSRHPFCCECSRPVCGETVCVTCGEWRRVRSNPHLFFIAPDHDSGAELTRIIERNDGFWVIEKLGDDAREITERTDPVRHPAAGNLP